MLIERPSKSAQNSQEYGEGGDTDTFNNTSKILDTKSYDQA